MRACFCVWCVKCAKYLAFGTFSTPDGSALKERGGQEKKKKKKKTMIGWYCGILSVLDFPVQLHASVHITCTQIMRFMIKLFRLVKLLYQ